MPHRANEPACERPRPSAARVGRGTPGAGCTLLLGLLLISLISAACSKPNKSPQPEPSALSAGRPQATRSAIEAAGQKLFVAQCAPCHGARGAGDGPAARALQPAPRDLGDATFHASVDDAALRAVISQGGAAVGKSPTMPGAPNLAAHPEQLDAVVAFVRSLRRE